MSKWTGAEWRTLLDEWDQMVRLGRGAEVREILKNIRVGHVPRSLLAPFCGVARRCQMWESALSALKPYIYPKVARASSSSPQERVEYALSLRRAGALQEAERILSDPALIHEPRAILAKAFGHMGKWDYGQALTQLDHFVEISDPADYETLVARVNQLACLSFLGDGRYDALAEDLLIQLQANRPGLLLANYLEISAQRFISTGGFESALKQLNKANQLLSKDEGPYLMLIKKWIRIVQAVRDSSVEDLLAFRKEALKVHDWETLRHLDFYVTKLDPHSIWSNRVYFGTPFSSFREKLEEIRPFPNETWVQGDLHAKSEFDPWFPGVEEGDIVHRLMVFLLRDWYRPASLGGIFDSLYEGEHFDIETSGLRVRQQISRLKNRLSENGFPFRLFQLQGQYYLRTMIDYRILMRKTDLEFSRVGFVFGRYRDRINTPLDAEAWAKQMKVTVRQSIYLLKQGLESGWICKIGRGRYTRYLLTPQTQIRT
ncbi:MAG: hypothetical protein AB7F86_19205 [Bdellovibrionales bacterium]